jgi:hypothetical protein
MGKPFPIKFELPSSIKQLRVERESERMLGYTLKQGYWRIWLTANGDWSLGTFLQLCDDSSINRITWHEDGTETVFNIKEKDHGSN